MKAMQREMDREGIRTRRPPASYEELPWERQVALAERRRYWFLQFGIDRRTWEAGYYSLWRVATRPIPQFEMHWKSPQARLVVLS